MSVDLARQHWAEGHRRLQETKPDEPQLYGRLLEQVGIVTEELKRRVGSTFTLEELADAYSTADRWTLETIAERGGGPGWVSSATIAADAAFHLYARGARDYRP